jgi:hypothetical protein
MVACMGCAAVGKLVLLTFPTIAWEIGRKADPGLLNYIPLL